ncbi:MAG: hypothetical protein IPP71_15200 [Bacteroidetes bacterium]|nr:hypothetical protein [Bacteroidota bacterium]
MKKIFLIGTIVWFLVSIATKGICQYNLVPNPSFELYDTCPDNVGQIYRAIGWSSPTQTSPDYHNVCTNGNPWNIGVPQNVHGYQFAKDGNGYAGIISYTVNGLGIAGGFREYVQIQLTDSLIAGKEYSLGFYVSPGDSCKYTTNSIGAYFSHTKIDTIQSPPNVPLPFLPQIQNPQNNNLNDRSIWKKVTGTFIASGGEKYIIIGNFNDTTNTILTYTSWDTIPLISIAVHYIDGIIVTPMDSLTSISPPIKYNNLQPLIYNYNNHISVSFDVGIKNCFIYNNIGQQIYHYSGESKYSLDIETKFF